MKETYFCPVVLLEQENGLFYLFVEWSNEEISFTSHSTIRNQTFKDYLSIFELNLVNFTPELLEVKVNEDLILIYYLYKVSVNTFSDEPYFDWEHLPSKEDLQHEWNPGHWIRLEKILTYNWKFSEDKEIAINIANEQGFLIS